MAPADATVLALIGNVGGGEVLAILVVALLVLGPERLPEVARQIGKGMHKARVMARNLSSEMGEVLADPAMEPFRELGELATRPKEKLLEYAREAEREERAAAERAALGGQTADPVPGQPVDEPPAQPADHDPNAARERPPAAPEPAADDDPTETSFPTVADGPTDGGDEPAAS